MRVGQQLDFRSSSVLEKRIISRVLDMIVIDLQTYINGYRLTDSDPFIPVCGKWKLCFICLLMTWGTFTLFPQMK